MTCVTVQNRTKIIHDTYINMQENQTQKDDGGPAFPMVNELGDLHHPGMTLRDYFAGHALAGEMVASTAGCWRNDTPQEHLVERAKLLYRMAEAMIEARKGTTT